MLSLLLSFCLALSPLSFAYALLIPGAPKNVLPSAITPSGFDFSAKSGVSNRILTPNNDQRNDGVVFSYSNPQDSEVNGEIFDLLGKKVADLVAGPLANTLKWDGRSGGLTVDSGIYFYSLRAEEKVFSGTLLVLR